MSSTAPAPVRAPTTAAAAANAFIAFSELEPGHPIMSPMKLQKMLFYAHAWHLAMRDAPLFEEDFEAWPWGPVVRDVYFETTEFRKSAVTGRIRQLVESNDGPLNFKFVHPVVENEETLDFLRGVWDAYKRYTAVQLSNATHAPGEPWTIVHDQYGSLDQKPTIPNEMITSVFKKKLQNASAPDPAAS